MTVRLVKYDAARQALAVAHRVDEAKDIRDKAEAMRVYARQAKDSELIAWATEIKLRAERRAGELLRETADRKERQRVPERGSRPDPTTPSLRDLGLTRDQSSQWQRLAAIPEREFEKRLKAADPATLTTRRVLRPVAGPANGARRPSPDDRPREDHGSRLIGAVEDLWAACPPAERAEFVDLLQQLAAGYARRLTGG